jgi:two-component system response regulator YesN
MGKAAALLMDPRIRVCEVAEAVGFGNSAYFCSVFKKHFGVTPREYRERHYHAEP